jgi:hypothetical protein
MQLRRSPRVDGAVLFSDLIPVRGCGVTWPAMDSKAVKPKSADEVVTHALSRRATLTITCADCSYGPDWFGPECFCAWLDRVSPPEPADPPPVDASTLSLRLSE